MKDVKLAQIFIILTFILAFAFSISAQNSKNNNKSADSVFALKEKLQKLKLLVSTEKDVRKVFGKKCSKKWCRYKEDWGIYVDYIEKVRYSYENNKAIIYKPRSKEYIGKLLNVSIVNYYQDKSFPDSFVSSENLKCVKTITYPEKVNTRICSDEQGLIYFVFDEFKRGDELYKNFLANIRLSLPDDKYNEIVVSTIQTP